MILTSYGRQLVVGSVFGQLKTTPSVLYLALMYSSPSSLSDGTDLDEPDSSAGYARMAIPNTQDSFEVDGLGAVVLSDDMYFDEATSDWGSIEYYGLCDSSSGGSLIAYEQVMQRFNVYSGDQVVLPSGALQFIINPEDI